MIDDMISNGYLVHQNRTLCCLQAISASLSLALLIHINNSLLTVLLFVLDNKYLAAVHEKSFALQLFQFSHSQKLGARKFQSSRRRGYAYTDLCTSIL